MSHVFVCVFFRLKAAGLLKLGFTMCSFIFISFFCFFFIFLLSAAPEAELQQENNAGSGSDSLFLLVHWRFYEKERPKTRILMTSSRETIRFLVFAGPLEGAFKNKESEDLRWRGPPIPCFCLPIGSQYATIGK